MMCLLEQKIFSCQNGTDLFGNDTVKCQANGSWTDFPQCMQRCDAPNIQNSNINVTSITSYASAAMINVSCKDNAKLYGSTSITCNNGSWSDLPTCKIYRCYKPTLGSHANIEDLAEYLINSTFNVTCDKGYDGNVSAECLADGNWNITGVCGLQTCPSPVEIPNSKDVYNTSINYSWNDTFTYRYLKSK